MAGTVLLVRHAEACGSAPGVLLGRTDPDLTRDGRRAALTLQTLLPRDPEIAYFCSPLRRARETAEIAVGPGAVVDADLREADFGDWEGMAINDLQSRYPREMAEWWQAPLDFAFPGGESLVDFGRRVGAVGDRLAGRTEETVVAFTHGGVIRALLCHYLGLDFHQYVLFDIGLASVASVRLWGGKGVLSGLYPPNTEPRRREQGAGD